MTGGRAKPKPVGISEQKVPKRNKVHSPSTTTLMNTARFAALPVARPRRASRASRPAAPLRVRAEAPEAPPAASSRMADDSIGLGGMMEDMMANAAGGTAVPGWVPAVPELEMVLKVLASDSVVISDKLLVERYGEALFAATGFTKRAEAINGRLAVRGRAEPGCPGSARPAAPVVAAWARRRAQRQGAGSARHVWN